MSTFTELKRKLLRRSDNIDFVELVAVAPFQVEVYVAPKGDSSFEELKEETELTLREVGILGVRYLVKPGPPEKTTPKQPLSDRYFCAAFSSNQSPSGLKETLVRLVPSLGQLILTERSGAGGKGVRFEVAFEDGTSSPALVDEVRNALEAIGYAGLAFEVSGIGGSPRRNDLSNAGFSLPRRDKDIVRLTEEDEDEYGARIRRLVGGTKPDTINIVDDFAGTGILATGSLAPPVPIHCLLPLYDRVYVQMPPDRSNGDGYFERNFGIAGRDFVEFCRYGKVVPIFKFNLGNYPRPTVEPWMTRIDLPFVTPRQLDYIALRHIWRSTPLLALLRNDRSLSQELANTSRALWRDYAASGPKAAARSLTDWLLSAAESFEGVAYHRGHIAAGNLSPAAPVAAFGLALDAKTLGSKAMADTAAMDIFGASMDIALAQAFRSSLNEGMLFNWPALNLVLPMFADSPSVDTAASTELLTQIVEALDLAYSPLIPASEYVDIFDQAETSRIRRIAEELLKGSDGSALQEELRQRVHTLNEDVRRISKRALETARVDVVGDLGKIGGTALGSKLAGSAVAEMLKLGLVKQVGSRTFDAAVEDTMLGEKLDRLRDTVNGVSPGAIRIYRVRSKLSEARHRR